jgi:hypothetical protein
MKQIDGSIAKRKAERMVRDAKRYFLDGFGIDWNQFNEPSLIFNDMIMCQIEWRHKESGKQISLNRVYWDDKNGAITQAGMNYGSLEM